MIRGPRFIQLFILNQPAHFTTYIFEIFTQLICYQCLLRVNSNQTEKCSEHFIDVPHQYFSVNAIYMSWMYFNMWQVITHLVIFNKRLDLQQTSSAIRSRTIAIHDFSGNRTHVIVVVPCKFGACLHVRQREESHPGEPRVVVSTNTFCTNTLGEQECWKI